MILVLASIVDEAAAAFASELGSATVASLLTCADLASAPLNLPRTCAADRSSVSDSAARTSERSSCGERCRANQATTRIPAKTNSNGA